jgi:hypothetical protein
MVPSCFDGASTGRCVRREQDVVLCVRFIRPGAQAAPGAVFGRDAGWRQSCPLTGAYVSRLRTRQQGPASMAAKPQWSAERRAGSVSARPGSVSQTLPPVGFASPPPARDRKRAASSRRSAPLGDQGKVGKATRVATGWRNRTARPSGEEVHASNRPHVPRNCRCAKGRVLLHRRSGCVSNPTIFAGHRLSRSRRRQVSLVIPRTWQPRLRDGAWPLFVSQRKHPDAHRGR